MRRGFTLIEVVLALLLFELGMLALAATTVVAARDLTVANRRTRAQSLAESRVAALRARACPLTESGNATATGGLEEHWRVRAEGQAREIVDSVTMTLPGARQGSVVLRAWVLCR